MNADIRSGKSTAQMETPITETPDTETTSTITTPEEPVSLRQLLARAGRVYDITIATALEAAEMDDLPMRGISVLRRIDGGDAGSSLTDVLRGGRISRQHGTQLIDTLVERGYIVREPDPDDRRRMRVALTERGRAAAEAVRTAIDGLNAALAESVTPEQLEASRTVLAALIDLAPEGVRPDADWGPGPDGGRRRHGPFGGGGGHGRGPGHRGPGRGPRGPLRDFDPRGAWRERMQAFAAATEHEDGEDPESQDERGTFVDPREGHPFGPRGGRGRGHDHSRHGRKGGHGRGNAPTIIQHADTVIVNAPADGRGRHRHGGHPGHHRGARPFGPWQRDDARQETPQTDAPANE
ncbi:MAG: winged helix DNA-binding protein [Thermomicrobiales bacterium]